jgi:hypothetical protein
MPRRPQRPPQLSGQVFRAQDALDSGVITRNGLRTSAWRRLLNGVYADSRIEVDHNVRCRAAMLIIPSHAAFCGLSAAWLHGVEYARRADPVEVVTPRSQRFGPVQGLRIHLEPLSGSDVVTLGGLLATSPARTAWDIATQRELVTAVVVLDGLLRQKVVDRTLLSTLVNGRRGTRGWRLAQRAFGLADGRAESFPESLLRIRLILADVPAPVPQHEVFHGGEFLGRVDLAWPEARVAVEYDGQWHASAEQLHRDRRRLNRLIAAGWTVLHVTSERLRDDFPGFVAELKTALAHSSH